MNQAESAAAFTALHVKGAPLVLYNIWDAGSAAAIAGEGATALATGSASVAGAMGFPDGQAIPLDLLLTIVERIVATTDLPVSVDFEGGYAEAPAGLEDTIARLIGTGAVGLNFEDQVVGADGIHPVDIQCRRIEAIRRTAEREGVPLYVNARTDLFLKEKDKARHAALMPEALARAAAYEAAGASGFFAPLLTDPALIGRLCAEVALPCNLMKIADAPPLDEMAALGAARVSYGPGPWRQAMRELGARAAEVYRGETGQSISSSH